MVTNQKVNFQTPLGRAQYAWLTKPDTKFNQAGEYKTNLIVGASDAAPLQDALQQAAQSFFGNAASAARLPMSVDEETGDLIFKLKSKFLPKFYDSQGNIIPEGGVPPLFGGSQIRIGGVITSYDAPTTGKGVTLNINKVQIVEAVSSSPDAGFDAVDGGFVVEEEDTFDAAPQEEATTSANTAEDAIKF
jgi:hypothetical protein|tara:strand:- start:3714 stop:4283 length:570 start_codon:yes stop_codon:yes gene_type:complete